MCHLAPCLAVDGIDQPAACLRARVGRFDGPGFDSGWLTTISGADDVACLLGKCRSPFALVQPDRPLGGGSGAHGVAGGSQNRCQRQAGVAVIDQGVGALGQTDSCLGDPPGLVVIATARQQQRPQRAPGDRRLQRMPSETLTLRTQVVGLGIPVERETRTTQQRGGLGGVGVQAHAAKTPVRLA